MSQAEQDTASTAKTTKGEQTRSRIVESAMHLFRDLGYDATTMRAVAKEAGVSVGNAYYYFASKEHLLQAYYHEVHASHEVVAEEIIENERDLLTRLRRILYAKLDVIEPYHRFSGLLFKSAADPKSPLNPFHEESRAAREESTKLFARVLDGSKIKIPQDIGAELPDLLWMYNMGIVLYWLHDDSEGRARTRRLVDHTSEIVVRIIKLLANPLLRPLRKSTLRLLKELRDIEGAR